MAETAAAKKQRIERELFGDDTSAPPPPPLDDDQTLAGATGIMPTASETDAALLTDKRRRQAGGPTFEGVEAQDFIRESVPQPEPEHWLHRPEVDELLTKKWRAVESPQYPHEFESFGETDIDEPLPVSEQPSLESLERMGPGSRAASVLTDDDLMELAEQNIFPKDLELSDEPMTLPGDKPSRFWLPATAAAVGRVLPTPVSIESQYPAEGTKYDRFMFLVERRNKVRDERIDEIYKRELKPQLATALAVGVTAASGVQVVSGAVRSLIPLLSTMSRNQIANLIVDYGMDIAFEAPLVWMVYDWATSDDDEKRIEDLEAQIEQLMQHQKDTGQ